MKTKLQIALMITAMIISMGCKKSVEAVELDGGAVNVTNAIIGASTLNMMTSNNVISANNTISGNNYSILPIKSGQNSLSFGLPPVAATQTSGAKPATVYYTQNIVVDNTSNYSLFLTGTSTAAVENVLIKETYTRTYADSVCGVRFINLAPGSNPISVNIKGSANGTETTSLAYKAYSNFVQHPAKKINPSYIFEFRDAATGSLITSYTLNTPYFHNVTLCLRGIVGGSTGVILDQDY